MNIEDIKKRLDAYNEFKELAAQNKADFENIHNAQNMFNVNSARDMAYLLSIIEQAEKALKKVYERDGYKFVDDVLKAIQGDE